VGCSNVARNTIDDLTILTPFSISPSSILALVIAGAAGFPLLLPFHQTGQFILHDAADLRRARRRIARDARQPVSADLSEFPGFPFPDFVPVRFGMPHGTNAPFFRAGPRPRQRRKRRSRRAGFHCGILGLSLCFGLSFHFFAKSRSAHPIVASEADRERHAFKILARAAR
jgi:hypothetical protein